jgi:hypothetical protein
MLCAGVLCLFSIAFFFGSRFVMFYVVVMVVVQLFKIMKDHKNPKVLCEGLSWMVTALEDFGIGHVPLKVWMSYIFGCS